MFNVKVIHPATKTSDDWSCSNMLTEWVQARVGYPSQTLARFERAKTIHEYTMNLEQLNKLIGALHHGCKIQLEIKVQE